MIPRLLILPKDESFFLFGPRGAGKTTLLKNSVIFKHGLYLNLLKASEENRFSRNPDSLINIVSALPKEITHIIIDEIQKVPRLLDIVHELIETTDKKFILTGSSARKLKHGGANLLAGRAFVYHLHTFTYLEINDCFRTKEYMRWGMLPNLYEYKNSEEKQIRFLEAYTNTYLKEEIWAEQFIRDLDPFRHFLEVAAQSNGKLINYSNIARDVGVDIKTVQKYFSILEDTLLGFFLPAFQHSFRKRLNKTAKFYFFDTGVVNTLARTITTTLNASTSLFGEIFEAFIITQIKFLADYYYSSYRFSYLATKDGAEIDLVVERPGKTVLFIEIKSSDNVQAKHVTTLEKFANDFGPCETIVLSRDQYAKKISDTTIYPWREGIKKYFTKI